MKRGLYPIECSRHDHQVLRQFEAILDCRGNNALRLQLPATFNEHYIDWLAELSKDLHHRKIGVWKVVVLVKFLAEDEYRSVAVVIEGVAGTLVFLLLELDHTRCL